MSSFDYPEDAPIVRAHYEGDGCEFEFGPGVHNLGACPMSAEDVRRLREFSEALKAPGPPSAEPLVRPLPTDAVGISDLLPGGSTGPSLVGHPSDVRLSFSTGEGGGLQSSQRKGAEVVAVQGVDRNDAPVSGSGAADDVFDGGPNGVHVHASSVDDNGGRCQELMTTCEHDWIDRGQSGDEWRECFLCGAVENR